MNTKRIVLVLKSLICLLFTFSSKIRPNFERRNFGLVSKRDSPVRRLNMSSAEVGSLEAAALKRKERLAALKASKENKGQRSNSDKNEHLPK